MGRGRWDFLEDDIARSEDQLEKLGANLGGVSRGIATDVAGLFSTPQRARDAPRSLAGCRRPAYR